jgi:hypothetical protein
MKAEESLIREKFGDAPTRWAPEEMLCEAHACNEVTSAVYLTEREAAGDDGSFFFREWLQLMGLEEPKSGQGIGQALEHDRLGERLRRSR